MLRVGHERTILVHHEQHECHWPHLRPSEIPPWLFLSSVGRDAHEYEDQIVDWLEEAPEVSLAFEPGTLQIARGRAALGRLFRRSAAGGVQPRGGGHADRGSDPTTDPVVLLDRMLGARTRAGGGDRRLGRRLRDRRDRVPRGTGLPRRRTGGRPDRCGRRLRRHLVAGSASGLPLADAMARAPVNSMRVVQHVGSQAGLLDAATLEALLAAAPRRATASRADPVR